MLKVVGKGNVSWWFRVPVPLLCCSGLGGGFTSDESRGDFTGQGTAQVQSGVVEGELVDRRPEFELVATAVALVAVVASLGQVDRERSAAWGR